MKTRVLLFVLASTALVAAGTATLAWHRQMTQAERVVNEMLSGERAPDAELLHQLGPQALPPLRKALRIRHPALERTYALLSSALPDFISRRLPEFAGAQRRRLNAAAWVGYL